MKKILVLSIISLFFLVSIFAYAEQVNIYVGENSSNRVSYGPNDNVGVLIDGDEQLVNAYADRAYGLVENYIQYYHGYRFGRPWDRNVFSPQNGSKTEVVNTVGTTIFSLRDTFPFEKCSVAVEYTISVYNEKAVTMGRSIHFLFYLGSVTVTPQKIIFQKSAVDALPAPSAGPPAGKTTTTWGAIKSK